MLEALGLDTGAVIFALLALSLARRGRRASVERVLNVGCALGSLAMNLLAADLTSPRSVTVWVHAERPVRTRVGPAHRGRTALGPVTRSGRRARRGQFRVAGVRWPGAVAAAAGLRPARNGGRVPPLGAIRSASRPRRTGSSTPIHNENRGPLEPANSVQ